MSPGLRALLVPAAAIGGALCCYSLPPRARGRALLIALVAALISGALLLSLLSSVSGGGVVERTFPDMVRGVPLGVRGDSAGVVLALLACAAALASLAAGERRPLERTGLLLCLGGTTAACLCANLYLLVGGLELGNVGALLMSVGATLDPALRRRAKVAFAIQHAGSLGLLAAALQLTSAVGTASFAAIPAGAVSVWVALPWAGAGALRLAAAAGLPGAARERVGSAWLAVAAVPSGLVTLLRLAGASRPSGPPTEVTVLLGAGGLVLVAGGAAMAIIERRRPAAVGRALLTALGGQVVVAVAVGGPAALTAAAAIGIALAIAALTAPAWDPGQTPLHARGLSAAALVVAGGLPVAAAGVGVLAATGTEAAPGSPHAIVGAIAGAGALAAGVAAAMAAALVMAAPGEPPRARPARWWQVRPDVAAALAASVLLGLLPGAFLGGLADHVASSGGAVTAVDAFAVRGPGFGWAGGYLGLALVLVVAAGASAASLQGLGWRRQGAATGSPTVALEPVEEEPLLQPPSLARRGGEVLSTVDRWLVTQPDIPVLVAGAAAALVYYSFRK